MYFDLVITGNERPVDAFGFKTSYLPEFLKFLDLEFHSAITEWRQYGYNQIDDTIIAGGFDVKGGFPADTFQTIATLTFKVLDSKAVSNQEFYGVKIFELCDDIAGFEQERVKLN